MSDIQVARLVKMLSLSMSDQLRSAVLGSLRAYQDFWAQYDWDDHAPAAIAAVPDAELPDDAARAAAAAAGRGRVVAWGADHFAAVPLPLFVIQVCRD